MTDTREIIIPNGLSSDTNNSYRLARVGLNAITVRDNAILSRYLSGICVGLKLHLNSTDENRIKQQNITNIMNTYQRHISREDSVNLQNIKIVVYDEDTKNNIKYKYEQTDNSIRQKEVLLNITRRIIELKLLNKNIFYFELENDISIDIAIERISNLVIQFSNNRHDQINKILNNTDDRLSVVEFLNLLRLDFISMGNKVELEAKGYEDWSKVWYSFTAFIAKSFRNEWHSTTSTNLQTFSTNLMIYASNIENEIRSLLNIRNWINDIINEFNNGEPDINNAKNIVDNGIAATYATVFVQ